MNLMNNLLKDDTIIRTKQDFIHRKIAENDVLISIGENIAKFNGFIELNETASYLWDNMSSDISLGELIKKLEKEYNIDNNIAREDILSFLKILLDHDMIEVQ